MKTQSYLHSFSSQEQYNIKHLLQSIWHQFFHQSSWLDKTFLLKTPLLTLSQLRMSKESFRVCKFLGILFGALIVLLCMKVSGIQFSFWFMALISLLGMFIGFVVPEIFIQDKLKTKQFFIQQAVPDFLDQFHLLVSSPAYESFGQALQYIAPSFPGYLGNELRELTKIQPFLSEQELLIELEKVCHHSLINELSTSIKVSSEFGSSLRDKTAQLLQTAQQEREHRIKDLGNKTSGMLLGPLLLFHLPALLIIFLIPFVFVLQKGI